VIIIFRSLHKVGGVLAGLEEPTQEMRFLRKPLRKDGHSPFRRAFERKIRVLAEIVPAKRATAPHTWVTD
jgi:hypothetical protein